MKKTIRRTLAMVLALALALTMAPGVFAATKVAINKTNFPDQGFRNYIKDNFDSNSDGYLSESEISAVTVISPSGYDIRSLKGIEYFTSLTQLFCGSMELTELDISKNTKLAYLYCFENNLSKLDVTRNTELVDLIVFSNDLTTLDISKNTKLVHLSCDDNKLTSLDVSKNTKLTDIVCYNNQIKTLNVSNNTQLAYLYCNGNNISSLDVSKNTQLEYLNCGENKLSALDVSKNTGLSMLFCSNNSISKLDLSKNTELMYLYCESNALSTLDVSKNTQLVYLYCSGNKLSKLDVSKNTRLSDLSCADNKLSTLDVSKNTDLVFLSCYNNNFTTLDLSKNTQLQYLDCNGLTALDVSNNTQLMALYCNNCKLTSLDLSKNTALEILQCSWNSLTTLDISNNRNLWALMSLGNPLADIDISNNSDLIEVYNEGGSVAGTYENIDKVSYDYVFYFLNDPDTSTQHYLWIDPDVDILTERIDPKINSLENGDTNSGVSVKISGSSFYSKLRVQRKTGSGSWTTLTSDATGPIYVDTAANKGGETYQYRVSGYDNGSWTDYSEAVSIVRNPFTDVKESASYFKALMWAYNNGIVAGTSTTAFSPNANCTRGQFALMLWRMNGKPSIKDMTIPFTDVPSTNGFYKGIVWCYNKGITAGTSATTYSPNDNIKRWQMILMFWRMQNKPASSLTENPFTDVKTTASYYKAALWAYEKGITGVKEFKPNDLCTRWQLVLFLYRLNNLYHYI